MPRPRVEPSPMISVDGRRVQSETRCALGGAFMLALSTAIPDLGVQLHSAYVGCEDADTQIAEVLIAPDVTTTTGRSCAHGEVPVTHARRRCLIDHSQALQDALYDLGYEQVRIDVLDEAFAALDG